MQASRSGLLRAILVPLACALLTAILVGPAGAMRLMGDDELVAIEVEWEDGQTYRWTPYRYCAAEYDNCCVVQNWESGCASIDIVKRCVAVYGDWDYWTRDCELRDTGTTCVLESKENYSCCQWLDYETQFDCENNQNETGQWATRCRQAHRGNYYCDRPCSDPCSP